MLTPEVFSKLRRWWNRDGVKLNPGATDQQFRDCERRLGVRLPQDVKHFYQQINGFAGGLYGHFDAELMVFLPLDELEPADWDVEAWRITQSDPVLRGAIPIIFADWSIAAGQYAFCAHMSDDRPAPVLTYYTSAVVCAPTFSKFMSGYVRNPRAVMFPDDK